MPNQAKGYSRENCRRIDSGNACRHMLRDPSAPTRWSHRTSCARPSASVKVIPGPVRLDVVHRDVR